MWTHIKGTSKSALLVLCAGDSPVTGEFPAQRARNAEKASIWWRHHVRIRDPRVLRCTVGREQWGSPMLTSFFPTEWAAAWWRHQMGTFSASLPLCAGNSPVTGEFSAQRPVTQSFDVFFDPLLNKRLSKQWWGWWCETPSCSLWCHCNVYVIYLFIFFRVVCQALGYWMFLLPQSQWSNPEGYGPPVQDREYARCAWGSRYTMLYTLHLSYFILDPEYKI